MNKNLTVFIIILIVAVGGIWYFNSNSNSAIAPSPVPEAGSLPTPPVTPPTTPPAMTEHTVTYTDSGFSPSTITINAGESITFINNSSDQMSVASNPHPAHTIYPEFDQYKTSQQGALEFTFAFTKVGTWKYHNHLNPGDGGTVIVKAIEAQ